MGPRHSREDGIINASAQILLVHSLVSRTYSGIACKRCNICCDVAHIYEERFDIALRLLASLYIRHRNLNSTSNVMAFVSTVSLVAGYYHVLLWFGIDLTSKL